MGTASTHIADNLATQTSKTKTDTVSLHRTMSEAAWLVITAMHEGRAALHHYETQRADGKSTSEATADLWPATIN
jgi:hypothetical protein